MYGHKRDTFLPYPLENNSSVFIKFRNTVYSQRFLFERICSVPNPGIRNEKDWDLGAYLKNVVISFFLFAAFIHYSNSDRYSDVPWSIYHLNLKLHSMEWSMIMKNSQRLLWASCKLSRKCLKINDELVVGSSSGKFFVLRISSKDVSTSNDSSDS